ncbi:hypothetical protein Zmor_003024 [Zophobas morio]|uniref:G-protein coupled receptors family 1 profile domain-containing protein n=1 Tax=Zophobas morio TaxID=2755281 RepID=A0AA38M0U5_9CUCU|nr:hypothetical protein Zmor_003024 [Zophobas morio]
MCYDINENVTDTNNTIFDWNELIPTVLVYSVTFVIGLVGNCLIIFTTFQYRGMQSVTNVFLSSLASADLLLIVICIPVKLAKLFSYTWVMGFVVCKVIHYMQNVSAICSVMTLTAISIERYYAIVHPMKAKYICTINQAKKIIAVIWIKSLILAVPTWIAQAHMRVRNNDPTDSTEYFYCVRDWDATTIWRSHEIYLFVIILIIPFIIMTFSYTTICWEVWKVMERRSVMTSKHVLSRNRSNNHDDRCLESFMLTDDKRPPPTHDDSHMVKQVVSMLVAVVVLFAICWAPLLTDNILTAYEILPSIRCGFLKYMSTTFHLLAYFNSCINPVIYGFMSKSFRESFKLVLFSCCSSELRAHRGSNYSLRYVSRTGSQTRTTSYK